MIVKALSSKLCWPWDDIIMFILRIILFSIAGFFSVSSMAVGNDESFDTLKKAAESFLAKNISVASDESLEIHVNQVYPPLAVSVCSKPIDAAFPPDSNKDQITAVSLTCNGVQPWHVLLPVEVRINTKVYVAKNTIPANENITEDDLDYVSYDKNRLYNGFYKNKEDILGQVAAQVITAGAVLTKKNLKHPVLVHRNQVIEIIARSNSVSVSMKGIAKTDGSLNQMVTVYNPSSKRTLDAVVVGSGKAEVIS